LNQSGEFTYPDAKTPAKRTYWVVQNKLLAGAYPGQPDPAKHLARLQALYDAGMRTFINLQEEGETNNAGQPFVRYDGDLREVAAKKTTPWATPNDYGTAKSAAGSTITTKSFACSKKSASTAGSASKTA